MPACPAFLFFNFNNKNFYSLMLSIKDFLLGFPRISIDYTLFRIV